MVTAAGLVNTGTIVLEGPFSTVLDITAPAPTTLTGTVELHGNSRLEFASGGITAIASGATLLEDSGAAVVALASNTGANSALAGLASNAGSTIFENGAALTIAGNFDNRNLLEVDESGEWREQPDRRHNPDQRRPALRRQQRTDRGRDGDRRGSLQFGPDLSHQRHRQGGAGGCRGLWQHRHRHRRGWRRRRQQRDRRGDADQWRCALPAERGDADRDDRSDQQRLSGGRRIGQRREQPDGRRNPDQ